MRRARSKTLVSFLCLICAAIAFAAEGQETELKPVAVAAFKNGLAFVVRRGDVKLASGQAKIPFVPDATLGSLWVAPNDPGTSLEELVAYWYDAHETRLAASVAEVLQANPGKVVTIEWNQKEYTGEIVGLKEDGKKEAPGATPESEIIRAQPPPGSPQFLLLRVEGKLKTFPLSGIGVVSLPEGINFQVPRTDPAKALRLKVKGANDRANLTMGYLEKGFGWTPSYLISLQDEKTARITMQAVVINDAEDIRDADVFFVVGVPNFAYSGIPSPMALQQSLADMMRDAQNMNGTQGRLNSNALMGQRIAPVAAEMVAVADEGFSTEVNELVGAPEEDLFLYSHSGTTLARGERATYDVFSGSVAFEHIYEWDIPDTSRVDANGNMQNVYNAPGTSDKNATNNVWHSLRLKNSSKFPWTSAPAMVSSGTKPVAQDTLPYTPKGASSNLKVTIATDIRASQEELEIERQEGISRRPGYNYDAVTVEGTLKLENYKSKDVHTLVRKSLRGTVLSSSDEGKAEKLAQGIVPENPSSLLRWDFTLKAGEKKTITYRYKILVHR